MQNENEEKDVFYDIKPLFDEVYMVKKPVPGLDDLKSTILDRINSHVYEDLEEPKMVEVKKGFKVGFNDETFYKPTLYKECGRALGDTLDNGEEVDYIELGAPTKKEIADVKSCHHEIKYEKDADLKSKMTLNDFFNCNYMPPITDESKNRRAALEGILVHYVDCGDMSNDKAEEYIEKVKSKTSLIYDRLPHNWEVMYISSKNQGDKVEAIRLKG